jgi:hypothetical protein
MQPSWNRTIRKSIDDDPVNWSIFPPREWIAHEWSAQLVKMAARKVRTGFSIVPTIPLLWIFWRWRQPGNYFLDACNPITFLSVLPRRAFASQINLPTGIRFQVSRLAVVQGCPNI